MATPQDSSRKKGAFGPIRLGVTRKYVMPRPRRTMMLLGGAGSVAILLYFLFSVFLMNDTFSSPGGLSSNHANFEAECAKCHKTMKGVLTSKCSTCHEKTNDDLGVYTYPAHYLYRSENPSRIDSVRAIHTSDENTCATCHPEHRGNDAAITEVSDTKCTVCHEYSSFNSGHPEFEFARANMPDDSTMKFTHVKHTDLVMKDLEKKTGSAYIEKACLYCHNPQPDGKTFKPLDFDAHCGDCHLTAGEETKSLAIKDQADPSAPGVETPQMIRQQQRLGTMWAYYSNPGEFKEKPGNKVVKSPLYHRDPWILENLKQLRRSLAGDPGLSDLLPARKVGRSKSNQETYGEAIKTLRGYVTSMRSRPEPEVQKELVTIDSLLRIASRKTASSGTLLPDRMFSAASPEVSPEQTEAVEQFAEKLTERCAVCHVVRQAGILGVKSIQRTLLRAEFNHRAHLFERRCLECHTDIPIREALLDKDTTGVSAIDRASTHNIPRIENCLECHTPAKASNKCVTCHVMHPNKENRGSLQIALDKN